MINKLDPIKDFNQTLRELSKAIVQFNESVDTINKMLEKDCWVRPSQVSKILGKGFNGQFIRELIRSNKFTYGVEYLNTSEGEKPNYLVNPLYIERYFSVPPEHRD